MSAEDSPGTHSGGHLTPNQLLLLVLGIVITLTLVVVLMSSNNVVEKWDPITAQGVVQGYLSAVIQDENEKASSYLDSKSECDVKDIDRAYVPEDVRIHLLKTQIMGDRASIKVNVDIPTGDPFSSFTSESHTLRLGKTNGVWKLLGVPWPMYGCEVTKK